ncbi:MAG: helix-turn-helix domain-containing protein [Mycobacteriaceae bacterium]|nr:helix-turn-helix domain-containing protein [Mycobacteriaceae bacterium]
MTAAKGDGLARVGRMVAERRLEVGFNSQRELAEKAGVALSTAALLERGHTFPNRANARKLEQALQWPTGTLVEIRRGGQPPLSGDQPPSAAIEHPGGSAQALAIANGVVGVAATCMDILVRYGGSDPQTGKALHALDMQLLQLETLMAASLPQADSFDDTMSALAELHRQRDAIKQAAAQTR